MKNLSVIILSFIIFGIVSCKKSGNTNPGIAGNWRILKDSTYSSGIGCCGSPASTVFTGTAADYFEFTIGGTLYIKEAAQRDTASYSVNSANQLILSHDGFTHSFDIITRTTSNLTLKNDFITPGGRLIRFVYLQKT